MTLISEGKLSKDEKPEWCACFGTSVVGSIFKDDFIDVCGTEKGVDCYEKLPRFGKKGGIFRRCLHFSR